MITGELLEKFTDEELVFPELPKTFYSAREYKKFWLYLIQYEIFCKLLFYESSLSLVYLDQDVRLFVLFVKRCWFEAIQNKRERSVF